jgi:hypothetical protein
VSRRDTFAFVDPVPLREHLADVPLSRRLERQSLARKLPHLQILETPARAAELPESCESLGPRR